RGGSEARPSGASGRGRERPGAAQELGLRPIWTDESAERSKQLHEHLAGGRRMRDVGAQGRGRGHVDAVTGLDRSRQGTGGASSGSGARRTNGLSPFLVLPAPWDHGFADSTACRATLNEFEHRPLSLFNRHRNGVRLAEWYVDRGSTKLQAPWCRGAVRSWSYWLRPVRRTSL